MMNSQHLIVPVLQTDDNGIACALACICRHVYVDIENGLNTLLRNRD
jgi:hypothetical protein